MIRPMIVLWIFLMLFVVGVNAQKSQVCIREMCFDVRVSETPESRQKGLMEEPSLLEDEGMLFIFEEQDFHSFWMKNTLLSLDILWIDERQRIVEIQKSVPACYRNPCPIYRPRVKAKYVLEILSGSVQAHHFQIGDDVDLFI